MKKHDKIVMLAKIKLNDIETLISQALIDMDISQENLRSENEEYKIMRLSSRKSKI